MSIINDPREKRDTTISDEGYEVNGDHGIWDVIEIDGGWIAAPPNSAPSGYRGDPRSSEQYQQWENSLPRFASAEAAIESVLR